MSQADPTPIPAATLVVVRDRPDGAPEILMVERARAMAFAGGALVFPGGRVDPADRLLAERFGGDADDVAARIAAIRETIEEAGLAIGITPTPDAPTIRQIGERVYAGAPIGEVIEELALAVEPGELVPFARWLPQGVAHKVFDTRFYLAAAPADAPAPRVDGNENVRLFWATAASVLADADAGRVEIIFPTRRNLERLARFASFAEAAADARLHPIETVTPWIEEREGGRHLCIPTHLGYPVTAAPIDTVRRA